MHLGTLRHQPRRHRIGQGGRRVARIASQHDPACPQRLHEAARDPPDDLGVDVVPDAAPYVIGLEAGQRGHRGHLWHRIMPLT